MRKSSQQTRDTNEKLNESRAFMELISCTEKAVDSGTLLFQLSGIHSMYVNRLDDLCVNKQINKTRLLETIPENQEHIVANFPEYETGENHTH